MLRQFNDQLQTAKRQIRAIAGDGNCMFRAAADQLFDDDDRHMEVRQLTVDYMLKHEEEFVSFLAPATRPAYKKYCALMRKDGRWGGHIELAALSKAYKVSIILHRLGEKPKLLIQNEGDTKEIQLAFHQNINEHYNSVVKISDSEGRAAPSRRAGKENVSPAGEPLKSEAPAVSRGRKTQKQAKETTPSPLGNLPPAKPSPLASTPDLTAEGASKKLHNLQLSSGKPAAAEDTDVDLDSMTLDELKGLYISMFEQKGRGRTVRWYKERILAEYRVRETLQEDAAED
ncbi:hypothetical protein KFL_000460230 [Klebsormidium nitens]|uniref:OTU domain-containing protein n=1 Tax=Klebsormidium nitens TaxID=105231 RepID=A0A1Y1HQP4_KLENI|nr:hypothetical protein KFL_000460230 [Klebsormidium nitens]|eukprot:GAQ80112.1 hypothetical protein KFL_000460230 [Klebsormidium nitens]